MAAMAEDSYHRASGEFSGWELRDPLGRRVGRVSRVFVDLSGRAVRVEAALGPLGARKMLPPVDGVGVDQARCYRSGATRTSENPLRAKFAPPRSYGACSQGGVIPVERYYPVLM